MHAHAIAYRFVNREPPPTGSGTKGLPDDEPSESRDFKYRVEVWDRNKEHVEILVAVSINPTVGIAAMYAAAKEYPDRYITLRSEGRLVTSWNPIRSGPSE